MKTMHCINVQQPYYFDCIKNGAKTIEAHIYTDKFSSILQGDVIKICFDTKFITAYVMDVKHYVSFYHFLCSKGLANTSLQNDCDVYHQVYTHQPEKELGVIVFELYVIV